MYIKRINTFAREWTPAVFILCVAAAVFLRSDASADGVRRGLSLCCSAIIPTLFPFLVISRLILESRAADILGMLLRPLRKPLGLRGTRSASAVLCGLVGGFAGGAKAVDLLYRSGEIDREEAERLLICCIGSGPAFVVAGVGGAMLHNTVVGGLLLTAQIAASLCCGALAAHRNRKNASAPKVSVPVPEAHGFVNAIAQAVNAITLMCAYVVFFSFFSAIAVPTDAPAMLRYIASAFLEVTGACSSACSSEMPFPAFLCCLALSAMGISVFVQVRALLDPAIRLRPLILSRLLHAPLALFFFAVLLRIFPVTAYVSASDATWTAVRMPADAICIVFILCALVFCRGTPSHSLRRTQKGV